MGVLNVFVSYRTDDTGDIAEFVAARLKNDLGLDAVFHAPTDTRTYDDWTANIQRSLEASQVVVALVGAEWTNCGRHGDEHEACVFDAKDWVGREVAYGLTDPETVALPVLVGETRLPDALPTDLEILSRTHGVVLRSADLDDVDYQQILTACWLGLKKIDDATMIVVTDGSDEAQVDLDEFIAHLADSDLIDASRLSATVNDPQGLCAVPLRRGAKKWPEVIALAPRTRLEILAARLTAAARMRRVQTAAIAGSTLAVEKLDLTDLLQETGLEIAQTTTDAVISSVTGSASAETASKGGMAGLWSSSGTATKVATAGAVIALAAGGVLVVANVADESEPVVQADGRIYSDEQWADGASQMQISSSVEDPRRDPDNLVGPPDYEGFGDSDAYLSIGDADEECEYFVVVEFADNRLVDGEGADLKIFEIGTDREPVSAFAVMPDGSEVLLADVSSGSDTFEFDLAGAVGDAEIAEIKLCDLPGDRTGRPYPGADIDAVGAIHSVDS